MAADELVHIIKQIAQQQLAEFRPFVYGHIANYDPKLHRVRVLIPAYAGEDGGYVLSPWMPLSSGHVGKNFGFQVAPLGGATQDNPTAGEAVLVNLVLRGRGVAAAASLTYNDVDTPPAPDLKPGEGILKFHAGTYLKVDKDGNMEIDARDKGNLTVTFKGDVTVSTTDGKITITSGSGDIDILVPSGSNVNLGGTGGRKIVLDNDPVSGGRVHATSTKITGV